MTAWDMLGIEPTDDLTVIKKAYAKKLKVHHPEEDPTGYQKLREAYDWAVKHQKQIAFSPQGTAVQEDERWLGNEEHEWEDSYEEEKVYVQTPPWIDWRDSQTHFRRNEELVESFLEKAEELYENFSDRISVDKWTELLNSDVIWNLELKEEVSDRLLDFLHEHPYLPNNIWQLMDNSFQWSHEITEDEEDFQERTSSWFTSYYKKQLADFYPKLSYTCLLQAGEMNYDAYLSYRELAVEEFMENKLKKAEEWFDKAYAIFSDDPELLRLQGSLFSRTGRMKEAIEALARAVKISPDDIDAQVMLAYVLYESKHLQEAAAQCEKILSFLPDHLDTLSIYGKSLYEQGKLNESRDIFKRIKKKEAYDSEAISYLASIHAFMAKENKREQKRRQRPSARELSKELNKPSLLKNISFLFLYLPKIKILFLLGLLVYSWLELENAVYINPLLFTLVFFFSLFTDSIDLSFLDFRAYAWFAFFIWTTWRVVRELWKSWRAARY